MLRLAASLLSSLQIGYRLKEAAAVTCKKVAIMAAAGLLLLAAATFGLVASYHGLMSLGFSPTVAAALIAMSLTALALVVTLIGPRLIEPGARGLSRIESPAAAVPLLRSSADVIDRGLGNAMQQVGPLTLLSIAFVSGVLAGRRR